MTCFSDDAIYQPGDGKTHRGKAEIRAAFEPQFNGAFGAMRFDEHDRVIDVENRKMTIRYVCRHDISQMQAERAGYVPPENRRTLGLLEKDSVGKASMYSISTLTVKSKKSIPTRGMDLARTFSANLGDLLG